MSIGLGENIGKSFGFAFENTVKHIGRWLGMTILLLIPIVNFIVVGMFLKVFRNEEPDFSNAGKSFVQGLLATIISIIYCIVPTIIIVVCSLLGTVGAVIGLVVGIILYIIIAIILIPAFVNFARNGFGAAFKFGELFGMIGKLGVGKYILAIILLALVGFVIGIVLGLIGLIPVLGWIVLLLATPILSLFEVKYWANLFE